MEKISYKLLVADDEYWTREKIRNMLDWEEYHIQFMKPAENGEEVLKIISREKPDILITDINMPFVNGVELVQLVKERYPEIVVFVISGYDDFEYVKGTLVAGAINYLLKPVNKLDLVNAISRALEIIGNEEDNKLQVLKAASLIQDREFSLLVEKEETLLSPAITLDSNMELAGCSVMLVKIHELKELMEAYHYDMNLLSYSVKKMIKGITGVEGLLLFNHIYRSNEFIIITELDIAEQKRLAEKILEGLSGQTKSPVTIAVSEHSYSIESIHSAYVQSVSVLMTRTYDKKSVVLFCGQEKKEIRKKVDNRLSQEYEIQMKGLLQSGNRKALDELIFETIGIRRCTAQEWGYLEVKQTVKRICNIFLGYLMQESRTEAVMEMENLVEMTDKVIEKLDVNKLCEAMEEIIGNVVSELKNEITGSIRDVVRQAACYVDTNYFEEMTLSSLSEKYCVESSYFSRMFKQETGKNLMLYIADKRIGRAKEYMRDKKINLTEIAFLVGYDDYTYFNKVFKKMTGKSPREYRMELADENRETQ